MAPVPEKQSPAAAAAVPATSQWDAWLEASLSHYASKNIIRNTRAISLPLQTCLSDLSTFDRPGEWDRDAVEINLEDASLRDWLLDEDFDAVKAGNGGGWRKKKMLLCSGNNYMGLSNHPAVRQAISKAGAEYGMGPRGSAVVCGYTSYHKLLEETLAAMNKKEDCLLTPTGFAANLAFFSALGNISSAASGKNKPNADERVAIFSDELNHASIIDGIRHAERKQEVQTFVYKHNDMAHLEELLSKCPLEKKAVVTDSVFSMDGDFAPMKQLVALRKKHGFLLAIDDAHGTLVCGDNGGGVAEMFGCQDEVDVIVGTLSKAPGGLGGFIACSKSWRKMVASRGRSFLFSTALPVPIVAGLLAGIHVTKHEKWRQTHLWRNVRLFESLTKLPANSPIIVVMLGTEQAALEASRHMVRSGFHVIAIRPPVVAPDACRLRITVTASHSVEDVEALAAALRPWLPAKNGGPVMAEL